MFPGVTAVSELLIRKLRLLSGIFLKKMPPFAVLKKGTLTLELL
jgi:hypothetical protein